jgi:hypothetical protein
METLKDNLKKHFDLLKGEQMYFVKDQRNMEFFEKNPLNNKREDVRNKISAINHTDINRLVAAEDMTDHILKLNIDKKLAANDLSVVEDIANFSMKGQQYKLLNFASIYCNYHNPAVYPIYSDQHLDFAKRYIQNNNLKIDPNKLDQYLVMKEVLDDIIKRHFGKEEVNYFEARKFGWLYLDKVLSESAAPNKVSS